VEAALRAALATALGSEVVFAHGVAGGDINQAYEIGLGDGRRLFAKANARSPRGMFAAEARGLAWLAEAGALRVPAVVAVAAPEAPVQFLALELVETGRPGRDFDERLGQGLAALHRHGTAGFGLDHDNFVGSLPQQNDLPWEPATGSQTLPRRTPPGEAGLRPREAPRHPWPEFYRTRRLEPLLRRAVDGGLASSRMRQGFERLFAALDALCGPSEPPARLHGDLWGGNLLCDERGAPVLIDPAVYGGHREIDLAMMRLFGGFGARVFDAYDEAAPLAEGHRARVTLYQLYPLMVHVNLFGGGYVGSVETALDRLA
jgi:fructosamine-3-kinase